MGGRRWERSGAEAAEPTAPDDDARVASTGADAGSRPAGIALCSRHEECRSPPRRLVEGDPELSTGAYLDLRNGAVYGGNDTDPMMVEENAAIDVEEEPDRWLYIPGGDSREGWQDMAAFAERQHDQSMRERLARAIEGKGAFRRFRDLAHAEGIAEHWDLFSSDRQLGRAREVLAAEGIRVGLHRTDLA